MKRLTIFLLALCLTSGAYADTFAKDGLAVPNQGTMVGGVGADGKFHFDAVSNAGARVSVPLQYTQAPSNFTAGTTDATVFTLAAGEIGFIQNLSADAPLAVKKGAGASTSSFSFILAAGTATDDGKGGAVKITDWVGVVSVAKITGTSRYIASKQAP